MPPAHERPHYVYINRQTDGKRSLIIKSMLNVSYELPLTADSAMEWARNFIEAAIELRKHEITQGGKNVEAVHPSGGRPSSDNNEGGLQTGPAV